jgi:hypothetical protein
MKKEKGINDVLYYSGATSKNEVKNTLCILGIWNILFMSLL